MEKNWSKLLLEESLKSTHKLLSIFQLISESCWSNLHKKDTEITRPLWACLYFIQNVQVRGRRASECLLCPKPRSLIALTRVAIDSTFKKISPLKSQFWRWEAESFTFLLGDNMFINLFSQIIFQTRYPKSVARAGVPMFSSLSIPCDQTLLQSTICCYPPHKDLFSHHLFPDLGTYHPMQLTCSLSNCSLMLALSIIFLPHYAHASRDSWDAVTVILPDECCVLGMTSADSFKILLLSNLIFEWCRLEGTLKIT